MLTIKLRAWTKFSSAYGRFWANIPGRNQDNWLKTNSHSSQGASTMNQSLLGLAFQESSAIDSSTWIIVAVVLVILFFIVVIVAVGLTIFLLCANGAKA